MQQDNEAQAPARVSLQKDPLLHPEKENGGVASVDPSRETAIKIAISDGVPATLGATAAMAVAGLSLMPALAVGLAAGLALTVLHAARSQRP